MLKDQVFQLSLILIILQEFRQFMKIQIQNIINLLKNLRKLQDVQLLLIPHSDVVTTSVGSGVVAINQLNGSDLVFVTDSDTGLPEERMRILANGNIGIGTQFPDSTLSVDGDAVILGNLEVNKSLILQALGLNSP